MVIFKFYNLSKILFKSITLFTIIFQNVVEHLIFHDDLGVQRLKIKCSENLKKVNRNL